MKQYTLVALSMEFGSSFSFFFPACRLVEGLGRVWIRKQETARQSPNNAAKTSAIIMSWNATIVQWGIKVLVLGYSMDGKEQYMQGEIFGKMCIAEPLLYRQPPQVKTFRVLSGLAIFWNFVRFGRSVAPRPTQGYYRLGHCGSLVRAVSCCFGH